MKNKHSLPKTTKKSKKATFFEGSKYTTQVKTVFVVILLFFLYSVFKNISYPLFWADESMTVVGAQRVLEFGYPKVHDGKNVFYDLRHSNPELGIDIETDAYIGGTSWLHYYYGAIGVSLAKTTNDIYVKTGIIRVTFAIAGIIGLLFLGYSVTIFFNSLFNKLLFISIYTLILSYSVSLTLLLREARYYPLAIGLSCLVVAVYFFIKYGNNRFLLYKCICLSILLLLLFHAFFVLYFIFVTVLLLSEIYTYMKERNNTYFNAFKKMSPVMATLLSTVAIVIPCISYFKIFYISKAMAEFNGYNSKMYWDNFYTLLKYITHFEFGWIYIISCVIMLFNYSKLRKCNDRLLDISVFAFLFLIVFSFLIPRIPNFLFSRYYIYMLPVFAVGLICNIFLLFQLFKEENNVWNFKKKLLVAMLVVFFSITLWENKPYLSGHIYELQEPYKGVLDYTIPYILDNNNRTDTLVVATNYEETSFMYYLNAKVAVGFVGNNLKQDSLLVPDIISYRKAWGNFPNVFNIFVKKNQYKRVSFPVKDYPVNNIPELDFVLNHQFKTLITQDEKEKADIYTKVN